MQTTWPVYYRLLYEPEKRQPHLGILGGPASVLHILSNGNPLIELNMMISKHQQIFRNRNRKPKKKVGFQIPSLRVPIYLKKLTQYSNAEMAPIDQAFVAKVSLLLSSIHFET